MAIPWAGELELEFVKRNQQTVLTRSYTVAPWKIQRSLYPEGEEICHCILLHTAGGLVGGDRLSAKIHLQPHTQALLTTATASKIYRSNGAESLQDIHFRIDEGASLEWFPKKRSPLQNHNIAKPPELTLQPMQPLPYGKLSDLGAQRWAKNLSMAIGDRIRRYGVTRCHSGLIGNI